MARNSCTRVVMVVTLCLTMLTGCSVPAARDSVAQRIVGAWFVKVPEAPFGYHMFLFNADGTMLQGNPDAGDPNTSDSNGMGAWTVEGDRVVGKFVEVTADRTTHEFVRRGEITFEIHVNGNEIKGTGSTRFYDVNGVPDGSPKPFTLSGVRVQPKR